jgi:chitinase
VASYGHSFKVAKTNAFKSGSTTQLAAYPAFDSSVHPTGDSWDDAAGLDVCGNEQTAGGNIDFWGMVDLGFLNSDGTPKQGIAQLFDSCSQTVRFLHWLQFSGFLTFFFTSTQQPFAYNSTSQIMVSYDNAQVGIFFSCLIVRG